MEIINEMRRTMARDVVSAKLDIIFKKLFTENKDMLHSFVASMLDVPQESISEIQIKTALS